MVLTDLVHAVSAISMGTVPFIRLPLLHFLALGAALHLAALLLPAGWSFSRETITVADSDLQQMRQEWIRSSGRPPTPPELQASILRWVGEEALFREALRLGLDRDDPVVKQRLLRNLRFADPARSDRPDQLLRAARALGMVRHDPVIRRRLVQRIEQRLAGDLRVSDAELREYIAIYPQRYLRPARYAFDNVFVAGDGRHPDPAALAGAIRKRLDAGTPAVGEGDSFALPSGGAAQSHAEIARRMGPAIAEAVANAAENAWIGPVISTYGWHLLRVTRTVNAAEPDMDAVREPAARALQAERQEQRLGAERARLADRYRIEAPASVLLDLP